MDGQEYATGRGWDFGVDLVGGDLQQWLIGGDGVANLLQPAGDGALCDAFTQLGHRDLSGRCSGCRCSGCRCSGCRRRWLGGRGSCRSRSRGSRCRGCGCCGCGCFGCCRCRSGYGLIGGTDFSEESADLNGGIFIGMDGQEYATGRGWDFGVDLVGGDLQQWLIGGDGVANLLQPAGDGALCDAFTQLGHRDRYRHGRISFISRVRLSTCDYS